MEGIRRLWLDFVVQEDSGTAEDIFHWCYKTLLIEGRKLAAEWGYQELGGPSETDEQVLALLERARFFVQSFLKAAPPRDRYLGMFFSPPVIMRERRDFNCVGGTILGLSMLMEAELDWRYVIAPNHVLALVRLPSHRWCYVDFINNVVKTVEGKVTERSEGSLVFSLKERLGFLKTLLALPKEYIVHGVLGNLLTIKRLGTEADFFVPGYERETELGREYYRRFRSSLDGIDFYEIALFPLTKELQCEVLREEFEVVRSLMHGEGAELPVGE